MKGFIRVFHFEKDTRLTPDKTRVWVGMGIYPIQESRVSGVGYIPDIDGQKHYFRVLGVGYFFRVQNPGWDLLLCVGTTIQKLSAANYDIST